VRASEQRLIAKPSPLGFARRYLLALSPLLLCAAALAARPQLAALIPWLPGALLDLLAPLLLAAAFALSWVLRSPEAAASTLLALALPIPLSLLGAPPPGEPLALLRLLASSYARLLPPASLAASLLTALAVEVRRRLTVYEVGDVGVVIRTGVWRRQEQTIPYASIGRVVLEQSLFGRLLDYGTVIVVSAAEWGAEYYTRSVALGAGRGGGSVSVGYARTLKEVSRDPGKCIYGVRKPRRVKEAIEARLRALG
jgi:hypothetical protein